jgi:alpha-amylase/alpha-mannosidase (GH57 family)
VTHWAKLLHFYQPPTQTHDILRKVTDESYRPLLKVLNEHANARVAVNMQGVLTEMLREHGLGDVVDSLRDLAEMGRVEFVGSGKFHPILPLIPDGERRRSIEDNARANKDAFGPAWRPKGFFPPEMCYSNEILPSVADAGHEWFIMSGVGCPKEWPIDRVYRVRSGGSEMAVLFRDDVRSNRISFRETDPQRFLDDLSKVGGHNDAYVVTAMDAETFGHHISGWERDFLGATFALMEHSHRRGANRVQMVFPSEVVSKYPAGDVVEPHKSSWSTSNEDLNASNPFPLWLAPGNDLHRCQWDYVKHCIDLASLAKKHATTPEARKFAGMAADRLQPALHSCQFWWASKRPMWDVSMIHRGFLLLNEVLVDASRAVTFGSASEHAKQEAGWRVAAANETRLAIEAELRQGSAP